FLFHRHPPLHYLPSFPTRRSSDLVVDVVRDVLPVPRAQVPVAEEDLVAVVGGGEVLADQAPHSGRGAGLEPDGYGQREGVERAVDRKSTRLNSSHDQISYAVFCLK